MNLGALQTALYGRLTGDAALMAIITAVLAQGDQDADSASLTPFPYVTIGGDTATPRDTKTGFGASVLAQIDVWSRSGNFLEAKNIASLIAGLLHHQPMTITGGHHVMTVQQSETYMIDPDGVTKRGLLMFRVDLGRN